MSGLGNATTSTCEDAGPVLTVRDLSKTFPGQKALDGVSLDLERGEIRALVGPNGSGKSTLVKVLAGYHEPDPGAGATLFGRPLKLGDPQAAATGGLRFVHQDLGLVPALGALDNLALGRGYARGRTGTISWRREAAAGRRLLHGLGYEFDFRSPVASLTAAERTGIAIARALQGWEDAARILVLDEPTAALPAAEVARLFQVIRMVQRQGVAIIYVSHHFNEVFEISDNVTVLRDGRHVATRPTSELDEPALIELTIGRALSSHGEEAKSAPIARRRPVLRVQGLSGRVLRGLNFDVAAGEIVGIAGVTGSGREEVTGLVYGARARKGEVLVNDTPVPPQRPDISVRHGIAFVPPDRTAQAALSPLTLRENTTLGSLKNFYGFKGLNRRAERSEASFWLTKLDVTPPNTDAVFSTLSGGNQQKVILARVLRMEPQLLILDEPTHGVDVGAKAAIHRIVHDAAQAGAAVLVASTESEELVSLCDRVLVLNRGRLSRACSTHALTADTLTEYTLGGSPDTTNADSQETGS